jgi:hypothetical protein
MQSGRENTIQLYSCVHTAQINQNEQNLLIDEQRFS